MTVFEIDDATITKAETLLRSPDFPAPKPVPDKQVKHDDLYTPIRPMKIATPVRVNKQRDVGSPDDSNNLEEVNTRPVKAIATAARVPDRIDTYAQHIAETRQGLRPDDSLPPDDGLPHIQENRHRAMLEQDHRGARSQDEIERDELERAEAKQLHDGMNMVQQEILRTKELLGITHEREQWIDPAVVKKDPFTLLDIQASMARIDAEVADFEGSGPVAPSPEEDRKLEIKKEVAALRQQVLRAKAARLERASSHGSSLEAESTTEDGTPRGKPPPPWEALRKPEDQPTDTAAYGYGQQPVDQQPVDVVSGRRPELWGSRRTSPSGDERAVDPEARRQQCLSGGGERICYPTRQCT